MSTAACAAGWGLAAALLVGVLRMRRRRARGARLSRAARAGGGDGARGVALAREPGGPRRALPLEVQLERLRAGLDDLEAARVGRRARTRTATVAVDRLLRGAAAAWRPAVQARGRLA